MDSLMVMVFVSADSHINKTGYNAHMVSRTKLLQYTVVQIANIYLVTMRYYDCLREVTRLLERRLSLLLGYTTTSVWPFP